MQKINFKQLIKIVNGVLGIIIAANFVYFLTIIVKESKVKQSVKIHSQKPTEIDNLFSELEKNSDTIRNLLK